MKVLLSFLSFLCLISVFSIIIGEEWKELERKVKDKDKKGGVR